MEKGEGLVRTNKEDGFDSVQQEQVHWTHKLSLQTPRDDNPTGFRRIEATGTVFVLLCDSM